MAFTKQNLVKLLWFYLGLFVMGFGYVLIIAPGLGAAPWDIFHLGVAGRTGIGLGIVSELVGLAIILINLTLGIRPTVGMVLNMVSLGPIMQWMLTWVPQPETLPARALMLAAGIFLAGAGIPLYVSAGIGSGPRDGLMLGLTRKLGVSVKIVRNAIDVTVALLGWWLGGPLGLGTAVVALGMGPAVSFGMGLVDRLAKLEPFVGFLVPLGVKR